jgi:hypothetical protein
MKKFLQSQWQSFHEKTSQEDWRHEAGHRSSGDAIALCMFATASVIILIVVLN